MKRLLLLAPILLALGFALPGTAHAFSGYIIFTVTGDPDDPVTRNDASTGWTQFYRPGTELEPTRPLTLQGDEGIPLLFSWEGIDWDDSNAFLSEINGNYFTGTIDGWSAHSGTYAVPHTNGDWVDNENAPYGFEIFGGNGGLSFTYQDHRGLHHGSGTWYQSATLPDYLAVPEPGSAGLAALGLLAGAAVRPRGSRGSRIPPGGAKP